MTGSSLHLVRLQGLPPNSAVESVSSMEDGISRLIAADFVMSRWHSGLNAVFHSRDSFPPLRCFKSKDRSSSQCAEPVRMCIMNARESYDFHWPNRVSVVLVVHFPSLRIHFLMDVLTTRYRVTSILLFLPTHHLIRMITSKQRKLFLLRRIMRGSAPQ